MATVGHAPALAAAGSGDEDDEENRLHPDSTAMADTASAARALPPLDRNGTGRPSERVVRAVAERLVGGRLAAAEPDLLALLGGIGERAETGALVRAVAERLAEAAAAGTPEIAFPGLDRDVVRLFLSRDRRVHLSPPAVPCYARQGAPPAREPGAVRV